MKADIMNYPMNRSVGTCSSKYSCRVGDEISSSGFQATQNHRGVVKDLEPAVVVGDLQVGSRTGMEKITKLMADTTESAGQPGDT